MVLLSVGLPLPLVAVFATIGFQKKSEGTRGIDATAKVRGDPSRSSQKNLRKEKMIVAAAIAKETGSLKLRSGADFLQPRH